MGSFVALNAVGSSFLIASILYGSDAQDWHTYRAAAERFVAGTLYDSAEWWYGWRYSPVAVFPLAIAAWIGETLWRLLHIVAVLALRGWVRLIALAAYPFWFDVLAGNVMSFVLVLAYWALRGNRWSIGGILVMTLLIPRPLMLPITTWLLWKHVGWRRPFAVVFVVHLAAVVATGYADEWLVAAMTVGAGEIENAVNVGPPQFLGPLWLLIGIPLAILLFSVERPAFAGLVLQPYWLPYYLLMPLADDWRRVSPAMADLRRGGRGR